MRTRFLTTNYFTPSSSSNALQTPTFLRLPVPQLPPPTLCNFEELLCSSFHYVTNFSLSVDALPIQAALSRLFLDVLPQIIDVGVGGSTSSGGGSRDEQRSSRSLRSGGVDGLSSEKEAESIDKEAVEIRRKLGCKILEIEFPGKGHETTNEDGDEKRFEIIQYETPELDMFLENVWFFENEEMQVLSEVPDIENNQDMVKPGLQLENPCMILESVYSVEDITVDYPMDQKTYMLEDSSSVKDQIQCSLSTFPILEVDDTSLGISTTLFMEDEILLHFEHIESHYWTQKDDLTVDSRELLCSMKVDMLEYFSDRCLSKDRLESELSSQNLFLEMDVFLNTLEISHFEGNRACSVLFEEFQILDMDSSQFLEVFSNSQTVDEPGVCGQLFMEDMNVKNFHELIVSHELALVDDTFNSLSVPGISDHEKIRSLHSIVEEIIMDIKPQYLSASDGIYLDWHLLEEDKCNCVIYSTYRKMLEEIDRYCIDSDLKAIDCLMLLVDFIFSDDTSNMVNMEENKELLNMLSGETPMLNGHLIGGTSSKMLNTENQKAGNEELFSGTNTEKVSSFKSMSQFNDLEFFLDPRKATTRAITEPAAKAFDSKAASPTVSSNDPIAACASTEVQFQHWDIKFYQVKLSDNIVVLLDNFQNNYLAIWEKNLELKKMLDLCLDADRYQLLRLPEERLMNCIKKTHAQQTSLARRDECVMALITLYAIKQMGWYLCFYGVHATHLYFHQLCQNQEYLKFRLSFLQSLIEDAHEKADKEITRSHPLLSVIQGILWSNATQGNLKVLIVAEQVFWLSLKKLLTSMNISFNELQNFHTHQNRPDVCDSNKFTDSMIEDLLHSDCLLACHEHISASFPFKKFSIILEHGGSSGLSKLSAISPKSTGLPCLHLLKMDLEDFSIPKVLCEGFDMPKNIGINMEVMTQSIRALHEHLNDQKFEKLPSFIQPSEHKCNNGSLQSKSKVEYLGAINEADGCVPLPVSCKQVVMESEEIQPSMSSFSGTVVVNTQNFDKEMLMARRSTYQRILAMEKEGTQVVERDSNLPVDILFSADICLVWYNCRNIGKKATTLVEASSCLPLFVEDIATNVLTLLSFTFSSCILVFEGEISFLAAIMESSDGLYVAAASLGIELQLFFSYSSEFTDEIILSCVEYATKFTRCLYPKMPESETLAESFLTKFPSVNPLTAHAILSSGGMLVEFLEWSHEHRIRAIQKYHVPDESVTLLSALCRYGEREDSKSGITDCSSSVSSAPDSENFHYKMDYESKRKKYIGSPSKDDILKNGSLNFELLNKFTNFTDPGLNASGIPKQYGDSCFPESPDMVADIKKPSSSMNNKWLSQKQGLDIAAMKNPSTFFKPYDSQMSKGSEMLHEIKRPSLSLNDKLFRKRQGSDMATIEWHNNINSEDVHKDSKGKVIDLNDNFLIGEDFSSIAKSVRFSPLVLELEEDLAAGKSKTERGLSFTNSSHPTFPTAAEISCNSDIWTTLKDQKQSLGEGVKQLLEGSMQRSAKDLCRPSFQEKETHYRGTPLFNALHSSHLQQGSPWTIEFLNRVREKSKLRQRSLPCDASGPCFGYSDNISKFKKRKSPSILEFFKYQGGSTSKRVTEHKRQKRSFQSSRSYKKNGSASSSSCPTWTPIDKRARQTLSFAMNGSGSQTKLVWSNENSRCPNRRF